MMAAAMKTQLSSIAIAFSVLGLAACGGHHHEETQPTTASSGSSSPQPAVAVPMHAQLANGRIEIDQMIEFEENSDRLHGTSDQVLDHVARVIHEHPEIHHVRVEGNTDNLGAPAHNQQLSTERATAVVHYLHDHGVTIELDAVGYGATRALCNENTDACRLRNRRVDFVVVSGADGGA
jgi:outer membrane protein OmpA-like peptidoglycan-associated protein